MLHLVNSQYVGEYEGREFMNKSKIDWCDMTWNPVTGCLHGCKYCYAEKIAKRFGAHKEVSGVVELHWKRENPYPYDFYPTFHKYRLDELNWKAKSQKIFVCSMADLFGEWVPDEWIAGVFDACEDNPQHKYIFLTKNPRRYKELQFKIPLPTSNRYWYGFTVTNLENIKVINAANLGTKNFISVEPLLSGPNNLIEFLNIHWIILGAQTGPGAVKPNPQWIDDIIAMAKAQNIPVFLKDNLNWPEKIQEFPEGLK